MISCAEHLFGCGDLDKLFTGHPRVPAPWSKAPKRRHEPAFDHSAIAALLAQPVDLVDVDPRHLWASQPWVVRHHAAYYRTGQWERTGHTSADHWVELNQFPVVVERRGRSIIVAGHHRATAALIDGPPLRVRVAACGSRVAVTPLLFVDAGSDVEPDGAPAAIEAGRPALVGSLDAAGQVLRSLGVPADEARRRVEAARRRGG